MPGGWGMGVASGTSRGEVGRPKPRILVLSLPSWVNLRKSFHPSELQFLHL